jgi:hypothetical protein
MTSLLRRLLGISGLLSGLLASPLAQAQPGTPPAAAPPPAPSAPTAETDEAPEPMPLLLDTQSQLDDLRQRMYDLEQQLDQTRQIATFRRPIVNVNGYVDFGFFVPEGNGAGIIADSGPVAQRYYPQYANQYGWVFLGDLLAPAVNSRGEVADLGNFPGTDRFDGIDSNGAPGFIVNEVNLTLTAALAQNMLATASVNFVPRTGYDFRLGDFIDVDLAQLEWLPLQSGRLSVFAGKFDSVIGIEYRDRKANQRFGITPSLLARYTTGTPLGVKARAKFFDNERIVAAVAVTNGTSTTEQFHFYDEVDANAGKTVSGRLSIKPFPFDLEIGGSGLYGAQDRALDSQHPVWFVGADLLAHFGGLDVKAQWLIGRAKGETDQVYDPAHRPYGLDLKNGGYLELDWMITPLIGVMGRGEFRDALVWLGNPAAPEGADRLYVTKSWRATLGARVVVNEHVVVKAEYLHNGEYGQVPQIPNDVFTSSLLLMY